MIRKKIASVLAAKARSRSALSEFFTQVVQQTFPRGLFFSTTLSSQFRDGVRGNPHPERYRILDSERASYRELLQSFLAFKKIL
jgi:hypothetical protein